MVVEVNGAELLEELRPFDAVSIRNSEPPYEWSSPMWPYVSALGERLRVILLQ